MAESNRPFSTVAVFGGATIDRIAMSTAKPVMGVSNPGVARAAVGGVGLNVASILARLGLTTRLIARVGDDPDGETILAAARGFGIDASATTVSRAAPTATYVAILDDTSDLIVAIADMKVCDELTPAVVAAAASDKGDGLWVIDANLPPETIVFLVEGARLAGRPVAAMTVSPAKAVRLAPVLDRLTYLFANRYEAAALLGRDASVNDDVGELAAALARVGVAHAVVTSGANPMAIASGAQCRTFTPPPVTVASVNGAGDSVAAGIIFALASGKDFEDAIPFGLAAAAMTLESGGVHKAPFAPSSLDRRIVEFAGAIA